MAILPSFGDKVFIGFFAHLRTDSRFPLFFFPQELVRSEKSVRWKAPLSPRYCGFDPAQCFAAKPKTFSLAGGCFAAGIWPSG